MQNIQDPKEVDFFINLGLKIHQLRIFKGITMQEFAQVTKIGVAYLKAIEQGQKNISLIFLLRIAKALNTDPENLVGNL